MKTPVLILMLALASMAHAQFDPNYKKENDYSSADEEPSIVNFGVGLGLDFGGIGGKLTFFPIPAVGAFAGVGYNFVQAGYNFGAIARILPKQKICPFVTAMYGYNAVIIIEGFDEANKTYYGASFGAGMEIRFQNQQNYLSLATLVPARSQEYKDDIRALQNNPAIEMSEEFPILISIGYHIKI